MRRLVVAFGLAVAATVAQGHDTWFTAMPPNPRGQWVLALGTGTAFPVYETPVAAHQLAHSGCVGESVRERPLRDAGADPTGSALLLRTGRPVSMLAAASCWAQLVPIDIQIDDATVEVYLAEIQALPAVRARWAALKARGVRWQETYVKHARLEIDGEGGGAASPALPELGLDARVETATRPLRAGDTVRIQVLRDGRALAGLPVQFRSELSPLGLWRTTDAEGRVEAVLPLAGRWILRGTDLRPATDDPDRWASAFFTLAFDVKGRP